MPELPEVETLARDLRRLLRGAAIESVQVCWSRSVATPAADEFERGLQQREILDVTRRGKFVQMYLSDSTCLLVHLGMSGHLLVEPGVGALDSHTRVAFHLVDGRTLVFSDPRKFGRVFWLADPERVLGRLGPDPLDDEFTPGRLGGLLSGRRVALKPLLLDQRVLAGLGNIYADESLFRAHLHPLRKANTLTSGEVESLYDAIREVLRQAIHNRGTTLEDARYRDAEGRPGRNLANLNVYHRTGKPCVCCGTPIVRILVGSRGTHFCPRCQGQLMVGGIH